MGREKGTRTPRSVGAYGSKRGTPNKQVARAQNRERTGRWQDSMGETRDAERALERRIAREAEEPALGETVGARYAREQREREAREAEERTRQERLDSVGPKRPVVDPDNPLGLPWDGDGKAGWTPTNARRMLRQGYNVRQVIRLTGVGYKHLNTVRLDDAGFGRED